MEYIGCYDTVIELVEEGTARFVGYTQNKEKFNMLSSICDAIDKMVGEMEYCEYINVDVDDITKQLTISVFCDDIIFQHGRKSVFFELIKMLSSLSFSKTDSGFLCINLRIDGVWEKISEC